MHFLEGTIIMLHIWKCLAFKTGEKDEAVCLNVSPFRSQHAFFLKYINMCFLFSHWSLGKCENELVLQFSHSVLLVSNRDAASPSFLAVVLGIPLAATPAAILVSSFLRKLYSNLYSVGVLGNYKT